MEDTVKKALKAVIVEAPSTGFNDYAKTYARAALNNPNTGGEMDGEGLRVQLLYVLNNLQYWKGERAREVKGILRKASQGGK